MARVWKWKCNLCETQLTEEEATDGGSACPGGCHWCDDDCCGVYPVYYEVEE